MRSVLASIAHRGPDGNGEHTTPAGRPAWQLFHTRLSIVDLSAAGAQPISNERGDLWLSFNGEIYNYKDLRRICESKGHRFRSNMDGEVILHLYEMEGEAAFKRLNGIFAFALGDEKKGELLVVRDPLGVKPLFFSRSGDDLWFASEIQTLRALRAPIGGYDLIGFAQFLSFLWIPAPRTPYEGIKALQPGHVLRWSRGGTTTAPYVDLKDYMRSEKVDRRQVVDELAGRFKEAVSRQMMSDVPVGLMASGGVDSGLIWWGAKDDLTRALTISWAGVAGAEGLNDDLSVVQELSRMFGTPVTEIDGEPALEAAPPRSGDLFADPAYGLTHLIAGEARDAGLKVLLSGQGGDELFCGYRRHSVAQYLPQRGLRPLSSISDKALSRFGRTRLSSEYAGRVRRAFQERSPINGYLQLCTYSGASDRARVLDCTKAEVDNEVMWEQHLQQFASLPADLPFLKKVLAVDLLVYMPGLGLSYADRAGMSHGVEIRVPLLDLELVRWSLGLPTDVLIRGGRRKWLLKSLAARTLSSAIAKRPKRAFAAPMELVKSTNEQHGERGYRQGAYFARAVDTLRAFKEREETGLGSNLG